MLAFYQRWGRRLYRLRPVFLLCCVAAVLAFFWLVFAASPTEAQRWQLSCVVLGLSSLLLWLWATVFYQPLPLLHSGAGFTFRLKVKLQYLLRYLLALLISVLLLATLYLGLRVLKGIIAVLFF